MTVFKEREMLWKQSGYCYAPKDVVFDAKTTTSSVLLVNDNFDPYWRVLVDGRPANCCAAISSCAAFI